MPKRGQEMKPAVRSSAERNALVEENMGLVGYVVGRSPVAVRVLGEQTCRDLATDVLLRCGDLFVPGRNRFSTYYVMSALRRLCSESRRVSAKPRVIAESQLYDLGDMPRLSRRDPDPFGDASVPDAKVLDVLLPREREILVRRHVYRDRLREIADRFGISTERARQIQVVAEARVRRAAGLITSAEFRAVRERTRGTDHRRRRTKTSPDQPAVIIF